MSYLNSVSLIGFVGADPEQRQARNNGTKFALVSVATQRSWKNAQDEWSSKVEWHRVCVFRPRLAEYVLLADQERFACAHQGLLVSSTHEQANAKAAKITAWSIRADVVRKLDCGEPEPEASAPQPQAPDSDIPF